LSVLHCTPNLIIILNRENNVVVLVEERFYTRYEISSIKEEGFIIIIIMIASNINPFEEWMWGYGRRLRRLRGSLGNVVKRGSRRRKRRRNGNKITGFPIHGSSYN
jgi:hypothetical protein